MTKQVRQADPFDVAPFYATHPHPNVLEPLAHPERKRYFVMEDDDEVVAAMSLERRPLRIDQVGGVLVRPDHQGQGLGRDLLESAALAARDAGSRWWLLGSYRREPDVTPFYRKTGFRTLVPYVPGASAPVLGPVARGLARMFRVEAGPDPIRILVRRL